jgi:hypothetical protein
VARMGEERKLYKVLVVKPEGDHLEDRGVDGRMGSQTMLGRLAEGRGVNSVGSGQGPWRVLVKAVMKLLVLAPRS